MQIWVLKSVNPDPCIFLAHEILLLLHCQSEGRKDADGKGEKFCRPTKKFSQASQIAEQSLTQTISFREGGMRDNEKYLR